MAIKPLSGIRVLDATSNIAGPFGGSILADLGAEVTKIEIPSGDPSRSMAPIDGDKSAYFEIVNRNKSVIEINLKSESGVKQLYTLLGESDVFLTRNEYSYQSTYSSSSSSNSSSSISKPALLVEEDSEAADDSFREEETLRFY